MSNPMLIIVPTYEEKANVRPLACAVHEQIPEAHMLFADDNSPDGTGQELDAMAQDDPRIHVLHRPQKAGLGRAYISGFKWALERSYQLVFEMDADFSHNPADLPRFVKATQDADLVLGSRYVEGIRITNWPLQRLILSKSASLYVRAITGMPVTDPTGGFKCFRREALKAVDLDAIVSNGYSFQVEMTHTLWLKGFRIKEIPITFEDRLAGQSKMNSDIFKEALFIVWRLALRSGFRRRPSLPKPPIETDNRNHQA